MAFSFVLIKDEGAKLILNFNGSDKRPAIKKKKKLTEGGGGLQTPHSQRLKTAFECFFFHLNTTISRSEWIRLEARPQFAA